MNERRCLHCRQMFVPYHTVSNQKYCSDPKCQNARKRKWHEEKMEQDPNYRENRKASQKRWRDKNKEYSKKYRETHPEYVETNRRKQAERNKKRKMSQNDPTRLIAKTDEFNPAVHEDFRELRLLFPVGDVIAKTDEYLSVFIKVQDIQRCTAQK